MIYDDIRLSNVTAPLSIATTNGTISNASGDNAYLVTAGGDLTLTATGGITLSDSYADMSTSGGDITLTTSSGVVTLSGYDLDLDSTGGAISISGVGVSQTQTNTDINAGSGKIRIDGGGGQIDLQGTLMTSDADSAGTAAIIIQDAASGAGAGKLSRYSTYW